MNYYPPQIEGKLPSQYGDILHIPFTTGYASADVNAVLCARIKTIVSNEVVGDILKSNAIEIVDGQTIAKFTLTQNTKLIIGQHYKIQLGWFNTAENTVSIYSTVGIFRYTSTPLVKINGFDSENVQKHLDEYIATYENEDTAEKPYQYRFILVKNGDVLESSGLQNYGTEENSVMRYRFKTRLAELQVYAIQCLVYTSGGLTVRSPMYKVRMQQEYEPEVKINITSQNNIDNGSISIFVAPAKDQIICGKYRILRSDALNNFNRWDELANIEINIQSKWEVFQDKTVQQGIGYKYAIQQYSDNVFTTKMETEIITCDFEDAFLYDGERQLKIRFNPKIASFKTVYLEQKLDTIGSKYPFIFRNGYTQYKEFSVAGLISLLMDDNEEFMLRNTQELKRDTTISDRVIFSTHATDQTGENYANEREFKIAVLNWLNNGKPKLFRSPAEGNYIVRLMNTSLTPEQTLGRLLHNFQSTAYEIASFNFETLMNLGLFPKIENKLELTNFTRINLLDYRKVTFVPINYGKQIVIRDATPGAEFKIHLSKSEFSILIGSTGYYQFALDGHDYITGITVNPRYAGVVDVIQYGQSSYPITTQIDGINVKITNYEFKEYFTQYYSAETININCNILNEDKGRRKDEIVHIAMLHIEQKHIQTINFEPDENFKNFIPIYIYKYNNKYYWPPQMEGGSWTELNKELLNMTIVLNDEEIIDFSGVENEVPGLQNKGRIIYSSTTDNVFLPNNIQIGNGLIGHMYYTVRSTTYEELR